MLSIQEADAIDAFIELLHGSGRLTEARLDALLKKRNFPVGAYVSSLKVLSKWYLCTDSNETLLQSVDSDNLNDISLSLVTIDEFGQKLSQELLEALVKYQSDCKAIYTGLSFLQSRIKLFTPAQAMTIITAGNAANSVSGNLVFLIQSGLDSRENCDSLLRTKDCAKSIEIILYQLKCKMAITQDNFNRVIEVAHLLADPVVMGRLTHISWSSPLTLPRIDALLSTLSTFSSCTTDAERDDLLATCATIIDPGLARGGNLSASSTLLYKMSPIL